MKKKLLLTFAAMLALSSNAVFAQNDTQTPEVSLDFTKNTWSLPEGSSDKKTASQSFSNGSYSITLAASGGGGYYFNSVGYLMLGKSGATLTFPTFDFDVAKIEIVGNSAASGLTKQNIFVGDDAVSTETTGAKGTNVYEIADDKQAAGTVYVLKVTSSHNTQITKINIYKRSSSAKKSAGLGFSETKVQIEQGGTFSAPTFSNPNNLSVTFSSDNEQVATVNETGIISLAGELGTAVITATSAETDTYKAGEAKCTVQVYAYNIYKKVTTVTSGAKYLIVAQRNDSTMYAYPHSETDTYGYMNCGIINENTDEIKIKTLYNDEFTITTATGGYTIQDCYSRYLWHDGTYSTVSVGTDAKTWTIEPQDNGTFKIEMGGYYMQWGKETYTNFGLYNEKATNTVLPMLYKFDSTTAGISIPNVKIVDDENAPLYNLAGQRVSKSYKGIVVKNGKKYIQR